MGNPTGVEVSDPRGERQPVPREATCEDRFGRGLTLVGTLADDWGVQPRLGVGKTVWAVWGLAAALSGGEPLVFGQE